VVFRAAGARAVATFADEPGGHRWQRVPPTERRGRVQTSTVTVAVLPEPTPTAVALDPKDLEWSFCRGSGAGGQHRNMTDTAVQVLHRPSGLRVRCETERSKTQNEATALALLRARLYAQEHERRVQSRADARRAQVGSGMRGDKRRTVRVQDGTVTDHVTGRQWQLKQYVRGDW
jgi:peptide chain release factor 1